jgi:hypothetical protein
VSTFDHPALDQLTQGFFGALRSWSSIHVLGEPANQALGMLSEMAVGVETPIRFLNPK